MSESFRQIIQWTALEQGSSAATLLPSGGTSHLAEIETLLQEPVPEAFRILYAQYDGQEGQAGAFLGLGFMATREIIDQLRFACSLVKPAERIIPNPTEADRILRRITDIYRQAIPVKRSFGLFARKWVRATCSVGDTMVSGITVEYTDGQSEHYALDATVSDQIFPLAGQLHDLERDSYGWDTLELELLADRNYAVKRTDYDWNEEQTYRSCPEGHIRKKYFHTRWLPVFQDFGGNYIGIDLDPGPKGTKGQVIIFGRDEDLMVVLAPDLQAFFERVLQEINTHPDNFRADVHLHEILKQMVGCGG